MAAEKQPGAWLYTIKIDPTWLIPIIEKRREHSQPQSIVKGPVVQAAVNTVVTFTCAETSATGGHTATVTLTDGLGTLTATATATGGDTAATFAGRLRDALVTASAGLLTNGNFSIAGGILTLTYAGTWPETVPGTALPSDPQLTTSGSYAFSGVITTPGNHKQVNEQGREDISKNTAWETQRITPLDYPPTINTRIDEDSVVVTIKSQVKLLTDITSGETITTDTPPIWTKITEESVNPL
jgi:hypothetical protein